MGKNKDSLTDWLGTKMTRFYIFIMCVVFPAFYTNKMFSLTYDKKYFFLFFTFVYACFLTPVFGKKLWEFKKEKQWFQKKDSIFAVVLLCAVLVSTVFALDQKEAFWEMCSRTLCGASFLGFILIYFGIRDYGSFDSLTIWGWLLGSAVIYLFGILCACKINFMYIQTGCKSPDILLTPLGNTNFNACFVCLMLPLVMVMFMLCEERFSQVIYSLNLYMGFLFVYFIKTESALLAVAAGIIILGYFALGNTGWLLRYIELLGIYLGAKATICLLLHLCREHLYPFDGMGRFLLRDTWVLAEVFCFAAFAVVFLRQKEFIVEIYLKIRHAVLGILLVLAGLGILVLVWINVRKVTVFDGSFFSRFILEDETFNHRGFIWKGTVESLKAEPLWRIFLGNGLNCYKDFMTASFREESMVYLGSSLRDPHNEMMQVLVDMGLIGVLGYFGLLTVTLLWALRTWRQNQVQIAVVVTLCVYLMQGLVNGYSIYHLPLLFVFLGLANGGMKQTK